jgi:hypothetical protein
MIELNSDGVVATRFGVNAGGVVSGQPVAVAGDGTTDVTGEAATAEPPSFDAVTTTRIVPPTSAVVTPYVMPLAPTAAQWRPAASQRCQATAYDVGEFDHVPCEAVSVCPTIAVPDTAGAEMT